ncbi:Uncharacterised protein [Candidatus Norongarragalina meridionalis]|nr:Uncharacterised protein [Candidatus Norongarragalina meridionalis]
MADIDDHFKYTPQMLLDYNKYRMRYCLDLIQVWIQKYAIIIIFAILALGFISSISPPNSDQKNLIVVGLLVIFAITILLGIGTMIITGVTDDVQYLAYLLSNAKKEIAESRGNKKELLLRDATRKLRLAVQTIQQTIISPTNKIPILNRDKAIIEVWRFKENLITRLTPLLEREQIFRNGEQRTSRFAEILNDAGYAFLAGKFEESNYPFRNLRKFEEIPEEKSAVIINWNWLRTPKGKVIVACVGWIIVFSILFYLREAGFLGSITTENITLATAIGLVGTLFGVLIPR